MDIMNGFTYILLIVWFAWHQVLVSGKLIHHVISTDVVEVVVRILFVPSPCS